MQIIRTLIIVVSCLALMPVAHSQTVGTKGMATVTYSGKVTASVKQDAQQKAKVNALDRYFAESNSAKAKNFELVRNQLAGNIDAYLLSVTVLSESLDDKAKTYTVVVRADLNTTKLENLVQGSSAMANTPTKDKSLLTFVFVARQQTSVQSYDDKVYKRADADAEINDKANAKRKTMEGESVTKRKITTEDSIDESTNLSRHASVTSTTGGSVTQKSEVVEWNVTRASEINTLMTGVFSNAGFEVVEAEYLEQDSKGMMSVDAIRADYQHGDDLSSATLRNTVSGVKAADIPYLALGTLDVGVRDRDPASGLMRVYVTVTGKVLDVSGRFPRTVSSVGPEQYAGVGPSETVARTNALKMAADKAAQQMVQEVNAKGVQ